MYRIISPASSANLACGFDSLGVCFDMANEIEFEGYQDAIIVNKYADIIRNRENLIVKSYFKACEVLGYKSTGLKIDVKTGIPVSRGLGSSASCICAGVMGAYLLSGTKINADDIFNISAIIEGHADNVAANIYGGGVIAFKSGEDYKCAPFEVAEKYTFISVIPDYKLSTKKARQVLPEKYTKEDAVFNLSHAAALIRALESGDSSLLGEALDDRLHQPYRIPLIENYEKIRQISLKCGAIGVYISGAGPTIMAISEGEEAANRMEIAFKAENMALTVTANKINRKGISFSAV
ncbi:MAG: homoserine kinase [Eubacteriaceae bacterium]|nr:homoserine kinase [Eubacteriaceae bacterium]